MNNYEFDCIINDITNHEKFVELKYELHHGISRYEHSLKVAYMTYKITKWLRFDYERATRAALLHDFYLDTETKDYSTSKTLKVHPCVALLNSQKYFDIDEKQANIIETHMFPLSFKMPKYIESWIVSLNDKLIATYEMYRYKASLTLGIWMIFLFNIITIQK